MPTSTPRIKNKIKNNHFPSFPLIRIQRWLKSTLNNHLPVNADVTELERTSNWAGMQSLTKWLHAVGRSPWSARRKVAPNLFFKTCRGFSNVRFLELELYFLSKLMRLRRPCSLWYEKPDTNCTVGPKSPLMESVWQCQRQATPSPGCLQAPGDGF